MQRHMLFGTFAAMLAVSSIAHAGDPNQSHFPSAGASSNINQAQSKGKLMQRERGGALGAQNCPNGTMEVGTVHVPKGTRAPRDVTVIVEGDVNNVAPGRTSPNCR